MIDKRTKAFDEEFSIQELKQRCKEDGKDFEEEFKKPYFVTCNWSISSWSTMANEEDLPELVFDSLGGPSDGYAINVWEYDEEKEYWEWIHLGDLIEIKVKK